MERGFVDGAPYVVRVPVNWNGTVLLYSHGYLSPGSTHEVAVGPDRQTVDILTTEGFALAGIDYGPYGWAVGDGIDAGLTLINRLSQLMAGHPHRIVAWGDSMGGLVSLALAEKAAVDGALPMCGTVAGSVNRWDRAARIAGVMKALLDPRLEVAPIASPDSDYQMSTLAITNAQATAAGRARLALLASVAEVPSWPSDRWPRPANGDVLSAENEQFEWMRSNLPGIAYLARAEVEARTGGNPTRLSPTEYAALVRGSPQLPEVDSLYRASDIDFGADLARLTAQGGVEADARARLALSAIYTPSGRLPVPVLTLHTTDDPNVPASNEAALANLVRLQGSESQLLQIYVLGPGHCAFLPSERIATMHMLMARLDSGFWPALPSSPGSRLAMAPAEI